MPEDSFFEIDVNRLDEEWVNHPKLAYQYYKEYEDKKLDLAEAQSELEVVAAGISSIIRKSPVKFGLAKTPTETSIHKTVIRKKKYRQALRVVNKLEREVGILRAATKALDHRKSALERLVSLHGQNYFSVPQAKDEDSREVVSDIEKNAARGKKKKKKKKVV